MNNYIFITKLYDNIYTGIRKRVIKVELIDIINIEDVKFDLYRIDNFYIINHSEQKNDESSDSYDYNINYWTHDRFLILNKELEIILNPKKDCKTIVAIHLGGANASDAFHFLQDYVDSENILKDGSIYLTFYSEGLDHINSLEDLRAFLAKIGNRINPLLEKILNLLHRCNKPSYTITDEDEKSILANITFDSQRGIVSEGVKLFNNGVDHFTKLTALRDALLGD